MRQILQLHIDTFFAGVTVSTNEQHVTDDYHQPEIFILPLNSYHTQIRRIVCCAWQLVAIVTWS